MTHGQEESIQPASSGCEPVLREAGQAMGKDEDLTELVKTGKYPALEILLEDEEEE